MKERLPAFRKLRGYSFDPSVSLQPDTVGINEMIYKVRWENLNPGPIGEYLEVIDHDPAAQKLYKPVDLDLRYVLAEDGLAPSEGNPQFHQQMVYAVAMLTIQNFEKALGRKILWSSRLKNGLNNYEDYVGKLRLYPHALREANAYYSPLKKAILFGCFTSTPNSKSGHLPGSLVFTCLSHDIIAHEVTHAILDGLHRAYNSPTNPDVLAFHEAFADIVALFQHFSFPEVLSHQIAQTRGELEKQNLLGQLAQQFGVAIGNYGSLRDALGTTNEDGQWIASTPDPRAYKEAREPHQRGSILVAAVFDAFLIIYKRRTRDLLRLATGGSGILPEGELHPDLVKRLASEAAKSAEHVLAMCIRALDYCPPVDLTFGDYLRAIITADSDLVIEDRYRYRLAFVDAFRRRGIFPDGVATLSEESLKFALPDKWIGGLESSAKLLCNFMGNFSRTIRHRSDRQEIWQLTRDFIRGKDTANASRGLHAIIMEESRGSQLFQEATGLLLCDEAQKYGIDPRPSGKEGPSFQVQSLRLLSRVGPGARQLNLIVLTLVQSATVVRDGENYRFLDLRGLSYANGKEQFLMDKEKRKAHLDCHEIVGGTTFIFDLDTSELKYSIAKPVATFVERKDQVELEPPHRRVERLIRYENDERPVSAQVSPLLGGLADEELFGEPFCFLHRG